MKKILMIVGSFRKESFNKQMANEIVKLIGDKANVSFLDYTKLPFMNQDLEPGLTKEILDVKQQVIDSDALWFCTPEYNLAVPGLLVNLIDWLSRSFDLADWKSGTPLMNKMCTISSLAGKSKGIGVRTELKNLLERLLAKVVGDVGSGISFTKEAFATNKMTFTDEDIAVLKGQVDLLLSELNK